MLRFFLFVFLFSALCFNAARGQAAKISGDGPITNTLKNLKNLSETTAKIDSFLSVSNYYVNKTGSAPADMQAATSYAQKALLLSLKLHSAIGEAESYTLMSQISRESGKEITGKKDVQKALDIFESHPSPAAASRAYFEGANYYNIYADTSLGKKIEFYSKGLKQLENSNPKPVELADAMKMMGDLYQFRSEYGQALPYLKRSLTLYQQAGIKTLQDIYSLLGNTLVELQQPKEGLFYLIKGVNILERNRDSSMTACQAYFNLGISYGKVISWNYALTYMLKANRIAKVNKDTTAIVITSIEVANVYRWLRQYKKAFQIVDQVEKLPGSGNFKMQLLMLRLKIYDQTHNYKEAGPYFQKLVEEVKRHELTSAIVQNAYIVLFEYMIATKQFDQVEIKLAELLKLPIVTSQPTIQFNFEQLAFKADSAQGDLRNAMIHLKKATSLQLAVMKSNSDKQIGRLQMEFETSKKDQDITFKAKHINLLTRQNDLQKSSLKYQKLVRNLLIAGAALLALLLAISYNRYKIKKMANNELEERQEEINTQNESLQLLLIERDWLLKEVHHRVKNNLQIVISLLNSQLNNIKDAVAKDVIRESQHRMHSISLIHQRLYQDDGTAGINMADYISDLTNYLKDSFGTLGKTTIQVEVEPLTLDVSQAVPLGLILNEAVTNAIKYAFTASCLKPHLKILLNKIDERTMELIVADNGKGLPHDFRPNHSGSLGMNLINGLTKQLKGRVRFHSAAGLCITIQIPFIEAFSNKTDRKEEYAK